MAKPPGRVEHGPDHIHIVDPQDPKGSAREVEISTTTWEPLDPKVKVSPAVSKFLRKLTPELKAYYAQAQKDIFETGEIGARGNNAGLNAELAGTRNAVKTKEEQEQLRAREATTPPIVRQVMKNVKPGDED